MRDEGRYCPIQPKDYTLYCIRHTVPEGHKTIIQIVGVSCLPTSQHMQHAYALYAVSELICLRRSTGLECSSSTDIDLQVLCVHMDKL